MNGHRDGRTIRYPMVQFRRDTWEIDEFDQASMFLLIGTERAMLIDCGMGLGDLRGAVEMLTDKPLIVVITHNHPDHTGNIRQFDEVWMNPADAGYEMPWPEELRRKDIRNVCLRQHANIGNGLYSAYPLYGFDLDADLAREGEGTMPVIHPLEDGMTFDLGGGRVVTAYKCPGHTPGQMMLLDHATRCLFCGDALNYNLGIQAQTIDETIAYMEHMQRLLETEADGIWNGHHDFRALGRPLDADCLPNALALARQFRSGEYNLVEVPSFWGAASGAPNQQVQQRGRNFLSARSGSLKGKPVAKEGLEQ